jgi:hypothetical protein
MKVKSFLFVIILATAILFSANVVEAQTVDSSTLLFFQAQINQLWQQVQTFFTGQNATANPANAIVWKTYTDNKSGISLKGPESFNSIYVLFDSVYDNYTNIGTDVIDSNGCYVPPEFIGTSTESKTDSLETINGVSYCFSNYDRPGKNIKNVLTFDYYYTTKRNGKYLTLDFVVERLQCNESSGTSQYQACENFFNNDYNSVVIQTIKKSMATLKFTSSSACIPNWVCGWSSCTNGYQTQVPMDSNNCGLSPSSTNIACSSVTKQCSAIQSPIASIKVTSPAGGEIFAPGQTVNINWSAKYINSVFIYWESFDINGNLIGSGPIYLNSGFSASAGSYSWTIPEDFVSSLGKYAYGNPTSAWLSKMKIAIMSYPNNPLIPNINVETGLVEGVSQNYFSIVAP